MDGARVLVGNVVSVEIKVGVDDGIGGINVEVAGLSAKTLQADKRIRINMWKNFIYSSLTR